MSCNSLSPFAVVVAVKACLGNRLAPAAALAFRLHKQHAAAFLPHHLPRLKHSTRPVNLDPAQPGDTFYNHLSHHV